MAMQSPSHTCTARCNPLTCQRQLIRVQRHRAVEDEVRRAKGWWWSFKGARHDYPEQAARYARHARESMDHARWLRQFHTDRLAALETA